MLEGKTALVVGVANEHSIAWGVARAMRQAGARLTLTYLNEKARPFVEPLAKEIGAEILHRSMSPMAQSLMRFMRRW